MIQSEIEQLLSPLITELGYELWGCEYLPQGKYSLLRIYVDKESGIGIEDCEYLSRRVSALLDVEDPIAGNYSLELSSPGIPRPLFKSEQYKRYIGHDVQIKLFKRINNSRRLSGRITAVNESVLMLTVGEDQIEVEFSNIVKANLTGE